MSLEYWFHRVATLDEKEAASEDVVGTTSYQAHSLEKPFKNLTTDSFT